MAKGDEGRWRRASDGRSRVVLIVVGAVLVLLALGGVAAYYLPAGSALTLAPASTAFFLLAASVPALVVFVVARQWWGALLATALAALLVVLASPLYVSTAPPPDAKDVVVMTSNMRLGQANADDVVREVRQHHVDVLMAQELTFALRARLRASGLDALLTHNIVEPTTGGAGGTGLWSRFPLQQSQIASLGFATIAAKASIPGLQSSPTLVALHVGGPVPDATNWNLDYNRLPAILAGLPSNAPVLVGGDFNATYSVQRFRRLLDSGYDDAGEQSGAGLLRTYPANRFFPPVIGIDHVLTRGGAVGRDARTLEIGGSDHRALLVTVALPRT